MKKVLFSLCIAGLMAFAIGPVVAEDQCVMCHQDQKESVIPAHSDCMACHAAGSDEHLANFRTAPEPVTTETCTTCHQPTDEFKAISAHQMDMECSACHNVHDK